MVSLRSRRFDSGVRRSAPTQNGLNVPIEVQGDPNFSLRIDMRMCDGPVRLLTSRFLPLFTRESAKLDMSGMIGVGDGPVTVPADAGLEKGGVFYFVLYLTSHFLHSSLFFSVKSF